MAITLQDLSFHGIGLNRPESVLCTASGMVFASDWSGGITGIAPDGTQNRIADDEAAWLRPNGIGLRRDGRFLIAHLGEERGGVFQLAAVGTLEPVVTELEGEALPPTNYVLEDAEGRVWFSVSTRRKPRQLGYRDDVADGFIAVVESGEARIVADGLGYTNEFQFGPDGRSLFVNETFARRLSRFEVAEDGSLGPRQTHAEFGPGTFPDGLAFDQDGGIWITSIVSNRVIRIDPDGRQEILLEDSDPRHVDWVEAAFITGQMGPEHLQKMKSRRLRSISSLAFGDPDLRRVYLGSLLGGSLVSFRTDWPGRAPLHWDVAT